MKSKSHVSGYLDVNTTIPEISKLGFAMNHNRQFWNDVLKVKNDGTIIINNYQIIAQSIWQSNKLNVSTSFDIVSRGLFSPIWGSLIIYNNDTTNSFNGSIKWKNKTISIDYKLENQKCHAVIVTPFRGFENADFKYALIKQRDTLFMEMEINMFKHHNHAVFSWCYDFDKTVTELSIISPLVGGYNISIGHSIKYGHLNEYFVIKHGYQNEIINAELKGHFLSILAMNLTSSLKFFTEEASVIVKNSDNPINSLIIVNWNKQYIKNALGISLEDKRVVELDWNFSSTLLRENATCKYLQNDNTYLVSIELPRHLKFRNEFTFKNMYKNVDNILTIETSVKNCSFNYFHTLSPDFRKFDSEIFISTNNNESRIILQGVLNENLSSMASLELTSHMHRPVLINFSLVRNSKSSWNPHFYVAYNNINVVDVYSFAHLTYLGSTISISFMIENYPSFDVVGKYDFSSNPNMFTLVLLKENFSFEVSSDFYLDPNHGSVTFNVTSNSDMERSLLNCNLKFNLENNSAQGNFEVFLPEQMFKYRLTGYASTGDDNNQADILLTTTLKNWDKLFCNFSVSFQNMEGNFVAGVNNQTVVTKYNIKTSSKYQNAQINILSDFDIIKNCSLSAFYNVDHNSRNFNVFGLFDNHEINLQSHYDFNFTTKEQIYYSNIHGKVNAKYKNLLSSGSEVYNLKMQILGKSKVNKTNAHISAEFDSNTLYFEKIKGVAVFEQLNYGHNIQGNLMYNNKHYNLYESFHNENGSCFAVINMTTPTLVGNVSGTFIFSDVNRMEIKAILRNYSKWYNVSISSNYESLLNIDTLIDVTLPKSKYVGTITNLITSNEMNCKAAIIIAKNKNFVKLNIKYPNLEKIKVMMEATLPSTQYTLTKLNGLYNFRNRNKFSSLQIETNYGYNLNSTISTKTLNFNFSTPFTNKGIVILGRHDVESVHNFSISFTAFFNKHPIEVYILHQDLTDMKTEIDVKTSYKDWERVSFLHLQDESIFHAQLRLGEKNTEVKLNKDGLFSDQTILLVNYQNYALNIWSGKEKTYLTVANPSTIYKIQVNYMSTYKQYGFAVYQDEMSLIDVITTITERNDYIQFQTKATNSLLPQYSDVVVSLTYEMPEFSFIVTNHNVTAISVYYLSEGSTFQFKFSSVFEDLKALQVVAKFQEDVEIQVIKNRHYLEETYELGFSFIPEKHRAGLKISVPFHKQTFLLNFSLRDNFIKLHAKTPINQWKELKLLSEFIIKDNFLSGEMQIQRNEKYLLANWLLEKKDDDVSGYFNIKGTKSNTTLQNILVKTVIDKERLHFIFEMNNVECCSILNAKSMYINGTFNSITNATLSVNYENQDEVHYNIDSKLKLNEDDNTFKLLLSKDSYSTGVILQSNIFPKPISTNFSSLESFKNLNFDSKIFYRRSQFGFSYKNDKSVDYWQRSSSNISFLQPSLGRVTLHTIFDKQHQMLHIVFNEDILLKVQGTLTDSIYFVDMNLTTCHYNGTVRSTIDYAKLTMLVNGSGYSEEHPITLNFNFNFNELVLVLETPFDAVKTFQLRGKIVKNLNMHNINATGVWNSDLVEYYGNIKTDDNFTIHSQLSIGQLYQGLLHFDLISLENTKKIYLICYYPSDKNKFQLLGSLGTESNKTNFNLETKTPFQTVSRVLVRASGSSNTIQFETIADTINQNAEILFNAHYNKPLQFHTDLKVDLPPIDTHLRLTTRVDNYRYGFLQVEDVTKNRSFSITYEKLDSKRFLRCKTAKRLYELEMNVINTFQKLEILYSQHLDNVNEVRANARIELLNKLNKSLIDSEISVRGIMQFLIKILVSETMNKIHFRLNDAALFYLDQTQSPKLQFKVSSLIDASVSSNGSNFYFNVNSDLANFENALIQTAWSSNLQRKMLTINLQNFGSIKNGKIIVNVQNQEYKLVTLLYNNTTAFVNVSAKIVLDSYIRGIVDAAIYDMKHFANFTIRRHGLSDLSIVSSVLPYNIVTLQLSNAISAPSILLFLGDSSLEHTFRNSYVLLQFWSKGNECFFKFDAPSNLQYQFLKIYGKLHVDNTAIIYSSTFGIKSTLTKNLILRSQADLSASGIKLNIYYTLPFSVIHSELDFDFYLPFSLSNNFVPKLFIYLPKSNFSLHCIVKYTPNEFCVSGVYEFSSETSNLLLHVVKDDTKVLPKITFNSTLPYVSNAPIKFVLEQKENGINNHVSILGWQAQSLFIKNNYLNVTLFSVTEIFSAEIQYQNAPNIFVSALLSHPHYPKKLGISLDLFFSDLKKGHINGMVAIPTILTTEFALQNNMYCSSDLKLYGFISAVKINDFNFDLKINSSIEDHSLHLMVDTEVDSSRFVINLNYDEQSLTKINFLCELQTPIPLFSDFRASLVVPKNLINGINVAVLYNKKPILHLDLYTISNNFSINFYNVLLPLSIECKYLKSDVFELSGNICWDFNSPNSSQLGGHIYLGNNISIGFVTPSRVMSLDARTFKNLQNIYYFGRLSWFKNKEISMSLSFANYTSKFKIFKAYNIVLSFPFRTFEITNEVETDSSATKFFGDLKWTQNSTSNIRLNYEAVPGKIFSKLFVPIWEHELILNVDLSSSSTPLHVKTQLMYSNDTDKHITFEVFNNEDIFKTEKIIILQHPFSKINYTIRFLTNRLPHASYGNISLTYTNYLLKKQEEIRGFLKISHKIFEVYGEIETTKNYVSILSSLTSGPHHQRLFNILQLNQKEPFVVEGIYNFKETGPSVSLVFNYGKERKYDLYGGFPSKRELTVKLSRTIYDEEIIEGHFNVKLNTSQMLFVKLSWKRDILWEYYNMIFNEYSDTRYIIESIGQEIIDVIDDDVGQALLIDFQRIRDKINLYIHEEISSLSNDYLNFLSDLENGYQSNSFYYKYIQETIETIFPQFSYLRDILVEPFRDFFQEVFDQLTLALQDIYSALDDIYHIVQQQIEFTVNRLIQIKKFKEEARRILRTVIDDVRLSLHRLENALIELIEDIDQNVTSIKQQCLDFLRPYLNRLEDLIAYIEQRLAVFQMLVLDLLDTIQNYVVNLRESKELIKMYVFYINWLEEFHITQILEPIADVLEQALATVINDFKKITEDYSPYLEAIFGKYEAINALPALVEFKKTLSTFSHRIKWIWNHHSLTDLMKNQVHQYVSNFDSYLVSLVTYNSSASDFENFFQSSNYIFRPDIGIIEITQPLPVEWDTFDSLPQFHQHPLYDKIKEKVENLIKIQKRHFGDMINTIKSYIGESSEYILSPPTNNIAMVIGDSNFFTFDKKYFKYKGNCSYLLTAEFVTTTFAVEVNFDPKRVITISTPYVSLKILSNSTVLQNNVKANLPIINGSLIVLQENREIMIDYGKSLKVTCNLYYNYCSVQLSGWLFGKVGGLLGTLDNDMSTDFNLPDGNKADDVKHFAESWKIGECHTSNQLALENNITNISPLSMTLFETLCQLFFTNINSPLASCFNIINTDPFYDICVNDMKDIKNPSMCSSIAAYRARCKYSSIDIEMPEMCIHCNYNIGEKEVILDKTTPKSIDVVIIKEINCFNDNASLTYLAKQLNEDFIETGYHNNRFSIAGYGSDKPYIYFSKNEDWMDSKTLSFDTKILPKIYLNNHKSISQTLDFILSKLEFRPGVSKQFITISCSSTDKNEDINNLPLIFGEKDITMHLMKLNAIKKTSKNALFVQNKLVVNNSLLENLNAVLKHEQDAIDVITLLALSSDGIAFHVNTKTKLVDNQILNAISKTISLTAKHSPCQRCKCVSNPDGTGKIDCTRCMSPIVKQLLNEYEANGIAFP